MQAELRRRALGELHEHARRQHGVVLSRQIRRAGLSSGVIRRLVEEGWLVAVRTGAYTVGAPATDWQRVVAAGLLAGPDVVVSHVTAATLHRFPALVPSASIELTAVHGRHPELAGVTVHRVRALPVDDVTGYRALTFTRPARTLVDLAGRLAPRLLAQMVDDGLVAGLWTAAELRASASRAGGRTLPWLDRILDGSGPGGEGRAESALEQRAQRALACLGPFETQWQVTLAGTVYLLDIAWPGPKVAAECDGWAAHGRSRRRFDTDRRRGNLLAADGWAVAHLTSDMSDDEMRSAVVHLLLRRCGPRGPADDRDLQPAGVSP